MQVTNTFADPNFEMALFIKEMPTKAEGLAPSLDLKLIQARNAKQLEKCIKENYEAWGGGLSIETYLRREMTLAKSSFSKNRKTWILIESDKNENTCLDILSACESYLHECIIVDPNGKFTRGFCLAIASVYTAERNRRKGYANQLLSKLLAQAKSTNEYIASALYSDIGPLYYASLGWKCCTSISLYLDLDDLKINVANDSADLESIEYLTLSECRPLIEQSSELVLKDAQEKAKLLGKSVISLTPTFEAQEWLWMRSQFYFENFTPYTPPEIKSLDHCGFKCKDSFVLFMLDFKEQSLKITMARLLDQSGTQTLLAGLSIYAKDWKLKKIEIWDPSSDVQEWGKFLGYRIEERQDHLSSLCTSGFFTSNIEETPFWLHNEKIFWV